MLDKSPKYRQVLDALRSEILSGRYPAGARLPSEADLVKRFGASRITVGRAVRELGHEGLIDRRAGSGTFVKPPATEGLTFGLLIPNLGQSAIFESICHGMAEASEGQRHALLWGHSSASAGLGEQALALCEQYVARRVDGVFFAPLEFTSENEAVNRRIVAAFEKARIPIVLLDRCYLPYPQRSRHDLVGIDNRRAGYVITEHLLQLGCRRIAFFAQPHSAATVEARIAGYREALFFHGLPVEAAMTQRFESGDHAALSAFLDAARPDAFVCANDSLAAGLMHALLALGRRIPEDIRIGGIDDAVYAALLPVPLTTIHQPTRDIGVVAMGTMLDRLAHPEMPTRDVLMATRLVIRKSSGTAQSS